jgi:hypothetical protein
MKSISRFHAMNAAPTSSARLKRLHASQETVVVCGAGGFIIGHLVKSLIDDGVKAIRAVDNKPLHAWHQRINGAENLSLDLQDKENCRAVAKGASIVYQLAADMGGMGFIDSHRALCMLSVLTIWGDGRQTRSLLGALGAAARWLGPDLSLDRGPSLPSTLR